MEKKRFIKKIAIFLVILIWTIWLIMILVNQSFTGKATSVANIGLYVEGGMRQKINLTQGWNFISFYVILGDYNVTKVLEPIEGYYDYLQEWDSNNKEFKIWSRVGQKEFSHFNMNKSYFIYMNQDCELELDGTLFENWTIGLVPGWETPDYIYEITSNVTNNSFYNATFSYMQKWNASEQEFWVYSPLAESNPFDTISPSEGYLLRTEGGNLTYIRTW